MVDVLDAPGWSTVLVLSALVEARAFLICALTSNEFKIRLSLQDLKSS